MGTPRNSSDPVLRELAQAFAPVHKRALGLAVGVVSGLGVLLVTAFHLIVQPPDAPNIELLTQYFYGYRVTWPGAFIGLWWGFAAGFVAGWFVAFLRNLVLATWLFAVRTKAELAETREFLDHI